MGTSSFKDTPQTSSTSARRLLSSSDISSRAHLRSAERRDMLVPSTRTELGRLELSSGTAALNAD